MFRNIISTTVIFIYTHRDVKDLMWDSVPRDQFVNIFWRCFQGMIVKSINFYSFKYWKLATIAMVMSLGPIFTLIFGFFLQPQFHSV